MQIHTTRKILFSPQELALIAVTMLWGTTFLIVHISMRYSGPLFFVGARFAVAGLLGLLIFRSVMRGVTRKEILAGATIGLTIFLGYGLQTHGLRTLNSSTSAFLSALYVPMVPLIQWAVLRHRPRLLTWLGIGLAFLGLVCLAGPEALHVGLGEGERATLLSAAAIAMEIILISRFAPEVDSVRITIVQILAGSLFSFAAMPLMGESIPAFAWGWALGAIGLGIASAVIQLTMNWAQKTVSPSRATIIYAGEPVWGGVVGRIAGDRLPALAFLGAAFIVAGIIVSELRPRKQVT